MPLLLIPFSLLEHFHVHVHDNLLVLTLSTSHKVQTYFPTAKAYRDISLISWVWPTDCLNAMITATYIYMPTNKAAGIDINKYPYINKWITYLHKTARSLKYDQLRNQRVQSPLGLEAENVCGGWIGTMENWKQPVIWGDEP